MIRHRSPISGVDALGDRLVATAGYDSQLILWDAQNRRSLARAQHDHLVNHCRFSASGQLLVSSSSDYTARVWSVPALRLLSVLNQHEDDVEMAVFNPDATRVATACRDHDLRVFHVTGGQQYRMAGHKADVLSVEWIRGGHELLSSSDDGTVRRWSADSGELLETIDLGGVETDTIAFDGENGVLYVGNDEGKVLSIRGGAVCERPAHTAGIKRMLFEPRRRLLLTASYDRTVKLWTVGADGELALDQTAEVPSQVWLRSAAFAGPTKLVLGTFGSAYAGYDLLNRTWEMDGVEPTTGLNAVRQIGDAVYTVGDAGIVRCNGRAGAEIGSLCNFLGVFRGRVITGGQMGALYDAVSGVELHRHRSPLNCSAVFCRDGAEHLIVGTYTGEGLVFRARAGGALELTATMRLHDNAIKGLACNERDLFSVCATGAAAFHAIDTLECTRRIPDAHAKIANGAACLADGRFLSVSRDRKLRIWGLGSLRVVATPHDHSIKCVAASPNGSLVATGAYDGTVALYDWRRDAWVAVQRPSAFGISSLTPAAAPDEFLASSYDGEVYAVAVGR